MRLYTRNTGGKALTKPEFFRVFNPAFSKAMTTEHAQAGFRGTGLFPVNAKAIDIAAFAPSKTTERSMDVSSEESCGKSIQQPQSEVVNKHVAGIELSHVISQVLI